MHRIVMHIDMNSYFASVEQQANPFLRGKPIGVTGKRFDTNRADEAQRSIIATASKEAKKLGIKTAMSTAEAKRLLPSLIIVPGDPEKYSEITHRFNKIFRDYTDQVEQFSVDESFLDVTATAQDYFGAAIVAQTIRARLREECGEMITASIGIAPNKLIAKLASESHKPHGLTVVRPEAVERFVASRPMGDFCGIGFRTQKHLEALGIITVEDLRKASLQQLSKEFKSMGLWLYNAARGIDLSPVDPTEQAPKSVGHSYTLPHDTSDSQVLKRTLLALCDKVAWRMRRDGYVARQVSVYVRYKDLGGRGQQTVFQEATANGQDLFRIAWNLFARWWDGTPVRLVGISAQHLSSCTESRSLFPEQRKLQAVTQALDTLQTRYGSKVWTRASLADVEFKARSSGWHYDHEL